MKRILLTLAAAILATAVLFAGCGEDPSSATETTATADEATTAAQADTGEKINLSELHAVNYDGNEFAGAWRIAERSDGGDIYESFVYVFDGDDNAYLMVGTMGYCEHYQINPDLKQFAAQLAFGINGKYTYAFAEDHNSVTLTDTETGAVTKLAKIMSFAYIPLPDPTATIDDALVGAWSDDSGGYLYFDHQGILYETQKSLSFTFYNYSAEQGKVLVKYYAPDETHDSYDYKVNGDTLTFNNYDYQRISPSELP